MTLHPSSAPAAAAAGRRPGAAPFQMHLDLLHVFLAQRGEIVERIQALLNAQRRPLGYLQDNAALARDFEDGFFALTAITADHARLRGQLEEAHWASGFRPRVLPGLHNGLADPAEMMVRAFHLWQQTRWPGRNGRIRYAHTLFNLYVIRYLALLIMRAWDDDASAAGERLARVQASLDALWSTSPADQPVLVRDARWLIQLAQSPATDDLSAYFDVAAHVANTLSRHDRLETHKAGVHMAAGHLRSQIRHYSTRSGVALDENRVTLNTRNTNALDFALLIQDLVPLLGAYEDACQRDDLQRRLDLAGAICQGLSPDPELFVNRVETLGAYSMIEHLFITTDGDGRATYTATGRRHVELHREYRALIDRLAEPLAHDCPAFRPVAGTYSPYGILYGFSSDLLEHMVLKTLQPDAERQFALDDVFVDRGPDGDRLSWVTGWRDLPHLTPEVKKLFDYPQQFAEDIYNRLEVTLRERATDPAARAAVRTGRLFVVGESDGRTESGAAVPDLAVRYVRSSDPQLVTAGTAEPQDEASLLGDRREARCLLSYRTPGGWVAISKSVLTEVLDAGRDAKIAGLPDGAAIALKLMAPNLVHLPPSLSSS